MTRHQLIGAQVSLYTGKVRAYLDFKGIPYVEVAATRDVYRDVIVPRTGVRFIPVLISADDCAVQDSAEIMVFLEARYPEPAIYPSGALQGWVAAMLEAYADEWLVIPAMHYRWNVAENRAFAIGEFGRLSAPDAPSEEQRAIGEKLSGPFAGALPALGVHPENVAEIEASYRAFLTDFERHLATLPFLFGTRPSNADFALYGPLFAHLYRDPASGRLMRAHAPGVARWVERMLAPQRRAGEFQKGDVVPDSLYPLLSRAFAELGPVLVSTARALSTFVSNAAPQDGAEIRLPRSLGTHPFRLGQTEQQRAIYPFNLWRWQRAVDRYRALPDAARERADTLLRETSEIARALMALPEYPRISRRENQLYVVRKPSS